MSLNQSGGSLKKVWTCSAGPASDLELPEGSDLPMREAVRRAFREITGRDPEYLFTGWGVEFTPEEQAYIDYCEAKPH